MSVITKLPLALFSLIPIFISCKPRSFNNAETASKITMPALEREEFMAQAEVWFEGSDKLVATRDMRRGPEHSFFKVSDQVVTCDFNMPKATELPGGRSPKFECDLNTGKKIKKIKVKYDPYWIKIDTTTGKRSASGTSGAPNYEVYGEIMATRLMWALGFGADNIYTARVNCNNCPLEPWMYIREKLGMNGLRDNFSGYGRDELKQNNIWEKIPSETSEFYPAVVEEKFAGEEVITSDKSNPDASVEIRGWTWNELYKFMDSANPEHAKKQKLHRDALSILMAFIDHYDNKEAQQRLVCLKTDSTTNKCSHPFMIVQDAGSNFGEGGVEVGKSGLTYNKMDIIAWEKSCIWDNPAKRIVIAHGSQANGTFDKVQVSEEGRAFLANLMKQLTQKQILDLFTEARTDWARLANNPQSPAKWAEAFTRKMQDQIIDARCR